ncbi:transmembrane 94-like protein [Labeo rohita]|uniref:Transmembrane 94-like protein n=1 Tax=Labeo rohita TaxID=84645 RepID=A0A498NBL1_LABRO|nr:transmembrane 94-like protein [Labeo rohita]
MRAFMDDSCKLVNGVLPLLPLTFPLLWVLVCMYGEARVLLQMGSQPADWWVLCCVDKQGILSWPSPNPEKILFFSKSTSSQETDRQRQKETKRERDKDAEEVGLKDAIQIRSLCSLQMLSLSVGQAQCNDTRVQFDDTCWQRHAPSLRPLGLAVQLVLCDPGVATRMLRLSDHLTHAALVRTRPPCQPVRPPWGLCHLPRILGFSTSAKEPFERRMSVAAYTLPSISCPGDTGIIAPPSVSMRRLPFSHLIALLVHHTHTGDLQLFSYGSADVILGACTEFWDGEDIQPLTDTDRQQIFLGLVSSQYQARPDVVRLISGLDSACIRFVYFSSEEEVRSKAKLPKGIENVRPHLENIDNVPLLVPLFTDCTSQTECEMVCIMQEYGEVVCCLGSSQNINNNDIFLQSDIRHVTPRQASENVFCFCSSVSCRLFSSSVSLLGKPSDNSIMKVPTGKNLRFLPKKTLRLFVLCFLVKFGLTVCTFLTCFGLMLHSFCLDINHQDEELCHPASLLMNSTMWSPDWYGRHSDGLSLAQKVITFLVLLNASQPVLNASFAMASRFLWHDPDLHHTFYISDIPMASWVLGILWLIPLVFINEGIKLHEIRMRVRYQKRQKLQFDTKLGMNSPF